MKTEDAHASAVRSEFNLSCGLLPADGYAGVCLVDKERFLSASWDQTISLWRFHQSGLQRLATSATSVADVNDMIVVRADDGEILVLVAGIGLEVIRLKLD